MFAIGYYLYAFTFDVFELLFMFFGFSIINLSCVFTNFFSFYLRVYVNIWFFCGFSDQLFCYALTHYTVMVWFLFSYGCSDDGYLIAI